MIKELFNQINNKSNNFKLLRRLISYLTCLTGNSKWMLSRAERWSYFRNRVDWIDVIRGAGTFVVFLFFVAWSTLMEFPRDIPLLCSLLRQLDLSLEIFKPIALIKAISAPTHLPTIVVRSVTSGMVVRHSGCLQCW